MEQQGEATEDFVPVRHSEGPVLTSTSEPSLFSPVVKPVLRVLLIMAGIVAVAWLALVALVIIQTLLENGGR